MEEKTTKKYYASRDADGRLFLSNNKPTKNTVDGCWQLKCFDDYMELDKDLLPFVQWKDKEPVCVRFDVVEYEAVIVCTTYGEDTIIVDDSDTGKDTPFEKSALALLKILQLIEHCYGGIPTHEEKYNEKGVFVVDYCYESKSFIDIKACGQTEMVAFHTKEQAKEFLRYKENIQLLKDYYQIP